MLVWSWLGSRLRVALWLGLALCIVLGSFTGCSRKGVKGPAHVTIRTADGFVLVATVWRPSRGRHPAILMIANLDRDRGSFWNLGERLAKSGFVAVALDLRLQGSSLQGNQNRRPVSGAAIASTPGDVERVLNELGRFEGVDLNRLGLLASSGSAELALKGAWKDSSLRAVALLSPFLTDSLYTLVTRDPEKSVFLACSFDDPVSEPFSKKLAQSSRHPDSRTQFFFTGGHGSDMLWGTNAEELTTSLIDWFQAVLGVREK